MQTGYRQQNEASVVFPEELVDLELLIPRRHLEALEAAAYQRGLSTAALIRRLLATFVARAGAEANAD